MTRFGPTSVSAPTEVLRGDAWSSSARAVPEEVPVAFVVDGGAEAVMMATPADLEDFALGFALSDGLVGSRDDLCGLDISEEGPGVEIRFWLRGNAGAAHSARRRTRMGPAGCGLCGIESLEAALQPCAPVGSDFRIAATRIVTAMAQLPGMQPLNRETRAVHAAAFYTPDEGVVCVREDVGRHNALDKLIGALAHQGRDCTDGVILMTSRVSIELIQKAARANAPVLAAISAPTALALRTAEGAGICICGIVRENALEVFTRADRIVRHAD
ncbi:MAG: formate dehydrogenase accessory sulfurtransferase FdhD [Terricaulis sp.]